MKESHFTFASKVDSLEIHCISVEPDCEPKAVLLMAHGIMEHKERYIELMQDFAERGYACFINDHRGFGESVRDPKDAGFTYECGADGMVSDTRTIAENAKNRFPGKKLCLYGHSMGALIAMNYMKAYASELSFCILSGLPANVKAAAAGKQYMKLKRMLKGARYRDESVSKLMFSSYSSRFKGESSPFAWINSDPDRVKEYADDPLCGKLCTVDCYMALLDLLTAAYDKKGWQSGEKPPVSILVGSDDPCAEGLEGVKNGAEYLKSVGFTSVEYKAYDSMRHEIHNEPRRDICVSDMLAFADKALGLL